MKLREMGKFVLSVPQILHICECDTCTPIVTAILESHEVLSYLQVRVKAILRGIHKEVQTSFPYGADLK